MFRIIVPFPRPASKYSATGTGRKKSISYPPSSHPLYSREKAIELLRTLYHRCSWEEGSERECWAESDTERFTLHYPRNLFTNEDHAIALGNDTDRLKKRLMESRSVLDRAFRLFFKKPKFDFKRKRLVSDCGRWALEWRVRFHPNELQSHENQQTNCGTVVFVQLMSLQEEPDL